MRVCHEHSVYVKVQVTSFVAVGIFILLQKSTQGLTKITCNKSTEITKD